MGGGGGSQERASTQLAQTQADTANKQAAIGQEYVDLSQAQLQRSNTLQQPLVDFYSKLTSGNQTAAMSAVAPMLGQIATGTKQAESNIYNTVPAGAGRDYALAQAEISKGAQTAGTLNQAYTSALQGEAQLGAGAASLGVQEAGAGLSGFSGAQQGFTGAQTGYQNIMNFEAQKKASTMGFLGSLAGAAGTGAGIAVGLSDYRLKENIEKVGEVMGLNIYNYNFHGDPTEYTGFMAQEVYKKYPDSVYVGGYIAQRDPWMIDYKKLMKHLQK